MGLLFPPKFTGANAPTAEEYQSGKVGVCVSVGKEEGEGREAALPGIKRRSIHPSSDPQTQHRYMAQVKVPIVVESLEWTLTSPPPLHQVCVSAIEHTHSLFLAAAMSYVG